jgi:predicted nucleotidyltransferase
MIETPEDEAARVIGAEPSVRRVILFGSRARGNARRSSDIDLAIDAPGADSRAWMRWMDALEQRESLVSVDLVVLSEAPESLRAEIAREGRVLFERVE